MRTEPIDRGPTDLSRSLGVGAGALATVAVAPVSATAAAVAVFGLLVVVAGVVRPSHPAVTLGATGILGGVLYAGLAGAPTAVLLAGVAATVVSWDLGGFAIDLGAQLGGEADTRRLEAIHALASVGVGALAAGVGYAIYQVVTGGPPVAALLLFLLAGLLIVATLDRQ